MNDDDAEGPPLIAGPAEPTNEEWIAAVHCVNQLNGS